MIRLDPDPSVALVAYRFPSESRPGTFHDAALMVGDFVDECLGGRTEHEERLIHGTRIVCRRCKAVLRFWACDCPDATFRDRACRHVARAIEAYKAERAEAAKNPKLLAKLCPCGNPALFLCDARVKFTRDELVARARAGERCNGATKSCDAPLCEKCRTRVGSTFVCSRGGARNRCDGDSVDMCPQHAPPPSVKAVP